MTSSPATRPRPFGQGTVSVALYTAVDTPAAALERLFQQASTAEAAGFDGVTISEHHAGFPSYLPNPMQVAGWILDRTTSLWAGPCPMLLPLRPTTIVAEELAWLAALHPDRVAAGVAPGYAIRDFEVVGASYDERASRFREQLTELAALLSETSRLSDDPAVAALPAHPVPLVAAAGSAAAARRAADAGAGMITDSLATVDRARELFDTYRAAGGRGPCAINRRVWVGDPPAELLEQQLAVYRSAAGPGGEPGRTAETSLISGAADRVGVELREVLAHTDADHLGLKVYMDGIGEAAVLAQIDALADALSVVRGSKPPG